MTQQEEIKVYELAKELGIDSISLLDKLKDMNIKVKSHMSSLSGEQIRVARSTLSPPKGPAKKTVKKVVRKRSTATAKKKTAGPSPVIRKRRAGQDTPSSLLAEEASRAEAAAAAEAAKPEAKKFSAQTDSLATPTAAPSAKTNTKESAVEPVAAPTPAPKKSFLKIVKTKKAPVAKPAAPKKGTDPTAAPSTDADINRSKARIIKMTKENLDRMAEEEAAKKKLGNKDQYIRPEDVRFADYKKREMIFLPKRKKIPVGKELRRTQITTPAAHKRIVEVPGSISVADLAGAMGIKGRDVLKKFMTMDANATITQVVDFDTATLLAAEFKHEVKNTLFDESKLLKDAPADEKELQLRPPIVTVMGHVDHGKTSLLDALKETNVVASEAGGITQHIGAYTVEQGGKKVTFIDTPGHAAFTEMRARGANLTDIVVLVVAADDGVMPQTKEAVDHARAAGVPIVVAVNKIDKPGANPEKVKQGLAEMNLLAEDWGGETMFIPCSALKKQNLDKLLEAILLNAEVLELKASPDRRASGNVVEARLEKGRGAVATVLIREGTLKVGASVVAGLHRGRVRAMLDHTGKPVQAVGPGMSAEIQGLEGVPQAGDQIVAAKSESDAAAISQFRLNEHNAKKSATQKMSMDDLFAKAGLTNQKELKVILKADVYGSIEAVKGSLSKGSTKQVKISVIHSATGAVSESDIMLASASNAIVVGFNVRPEGKARRLAEKEGVEVKTYKVIYELLDEIKSAMAGLLDKKKVENFLGRAEVRDTFTIPKIGTIAGCSVTEGKITRNAEVRLLRDGKVVHAGKISSLKRFKDDAKEVASGYECGIGIEGYNDLKPSDEIEAFEVELVAQELEADGSN